jgi:proteasome lid subunit RPN8/RPN11
MILFEPAHLKTIVDAAEAASPAEACGLLLGTRERQNDGTPARVVRVVASRNLATDPHQHFEIDPALRLRLQREGRAAGLMVIGHYHSHPDGPARPSPADLAAAWEADMVWVIVALVAGQAVHLTAWKPAPDGTHFRQIPLHTSPWRPGPTGPARVLDSLTRCARSQRRPEK